MISIGKLIRARSKNNMTQENVANYFDITQAYYSMIESGKKKPSLKISEKIIKLFGEQVVDGNWKRRVLKK